MAQTGPAKIKGTAIKQVCIVVNDLLKTVDAFWNILGIGPWALFTFGSPTLRDRKYHGKSAWGWEKGALVQVGPMELELFQTIEGASVYRDWIDKHGEGLHHVKFITDDMDVERAKKIMAEQGFPSILSGRFGPPEYKGQFCYFDTIKSLHAIWETSNAPYPRVPPPDAIFHPKETTINPTKVKIEGINKVGIVVKDVQKTVENYWRILGIGPWETYDWESPLVYERKYHGRPTWAREKIAKTIVGEVELELCQPVAGDSIFQDFLVVHGEGLHHLQFSVDDVEDTVKILADQDFSSLQSGRFGLPEYNGAFYYIEIKPLHCIWKLVKPGGPKQE